MRKHKQLSNQSTRNNGFEYVPGGIPPFLIFRNFVDSSTGEAYAIYWFLLHNLERQNG